LPSFEQLRHERDTCALDATISSFWHFGQIRLYFFSGIKTPFTIKVSANAAITLAKKKSRLKVSLRAAFGGMITED